MQCIYIANSLQGNRRNLVGILRRIFMMILEMKRSKTYESYSKQEFFVLRVNRISCFDMFYA